MKHYLFAKLFGHLSADKLMDTCASLGLDGPTLMIRDGFWVTRENLRGTLPTFMAAARRHGLEIAYADTPFAMEELAACGEELRMLCDAGIRQFRVGYISKNAAGTMRGLADYTRRQAEMTAKAAEQAGMQAIIQIHGHLYPHSATTAYMAVRELDPRYIGIKIDPGNNLCQEGFEVFDYQIRLLGEYVAALGAKDGRMVRSGDTHGDTCGWVREFAPIQEGAANYPQILRELKAVGFTGPAVLMPFYHEHDFGRLLDTLREEIACLKEMEAREGM